jgi:hypothetical protein
MKHLTATTLKLQKRNINSNFRLRKQYSDYKSFVNTNKDKKNGVTNESNELHK